MAHFVPPSPQLVLGVAIGLLASAVVSSSHFSISSYFSTASAGHLAVAFLVLAGLLFLQEHHRRRRQRQVLVPEKVDACCASTGCCSGGDNDKQHCCDAPSPPPLTGGGVPPALRAIQFTINGEVRSVDLERSAASTMLLSTYLREHERLTGVKLSCREGGCGACTVLLRHPHEEHAVPINSCLRLLAACDGCALTTIEGIGTSAKPHPFQEKLAAANGSQCGFCSPGMVSAIVGLLEQTTAKGTPPTPEQVELALDGNLCRCTGYRKILEAAQELVASGEAMPLDAVHIASRTACDGSTSSSSSSSSSATSDEEHHKDRQHPHHQQQHPVEDIEDLMANMCRAEETWKKPARAARKAEKAKAEGHVDGGEEEEEEGARRSKGCLAKRTSPRVSLPAKAAADAASSPSVFLPTTLQDAAALVAANPKALIVGANSGNVGVSKYYDGRSSGGPAPPAPPAIIVVERVAEMAKVDEAADGTLTLGAAAPLATLLKMAESRRGPKPYRDGDRWAAFATHLHRVANNQVRSVGTLGGNLMLAHSHGLFPSDIALLLTSIGASLVVCDCQTFKTSHVPMTQFYSYDMASKLLVSIVLPPPPSSSSSSSPSGNGVAAPGKTVEYFFSFKTALRQQNAHAIVNAALAICVDSSSKVVTSATLCYGGLKKHEVTVANDAAKALVRSPLGSDTALKAALSALTPIVNAVDASFGRTSFRQSLVRTLFYKGVLRACKAAGVTSLPPALASASTPYTRPISSGTDDIKGAENPAFFPVSQPTPKLTEIEQCTGETAYTDDAPRAAGQLFGAFALSQTHGTLASLSVAAASKAPGVTKVLTASDLSKAGLTASLSDYSDEVLLVAIHKTVPHAGARLALVCASTREEAEAAVRLVEATITPPPASTPTVTDFAGAIAQKRYFDQKAGTLRVGDAAAALQKADVVVKGSVECGHQYHFYMETQTASAQKDGNGGVTVTVATQSPARVASTVARCLGLDDSHVEAKMARAGGGYGGKGSRSIPCAAGAACASWLLDAPVAIALDINSNMAMLGSRRPHRLDFTAGARSDGTIVAVQGTTWSIQGCDSDMGSLSMSLDLSSSLDGPYRIANWSIDGYCCQTDTPHNTFCRGPIWLPGQLLIESVVDKVASACKLSSHQVKLQNVYQPGDTALGGQTLPNCTLPKLVRMVCDKASYTQLSKAVAAFNQGSRFVKEGVAISPFRYGMGHATGYSAVVTVHDDGSVLVEQSGCELGQGLNVKQAQCAALTLGVPIELVKVAGVTSKVSTGSTGGSTTSEGNVASVRLACEDVKKKLAPVRAKLERNTLRHRAATWSEVVEAAVAEGVDKKGYGRYSRKDREVTKAGQVVLPGDSGYGGSEYCAFGAALTHLRYDALNAELTILRAELVTDQGYSLNPMIDAGQVQGAYVMGLGYVLTEQFGWEAKSGANATNGTWEYKPPSSLDIPVQFDVSFLPNSPNAAGIFSSKAVGEPALLASASVLGALRHAIAEVRAEMGVDEPFDLSAPATPDEVQKLCMLDWKKFRLV